MLDSDSTTVLHEIDGRGVLTLTLNRPQRHNAYTLEMETALHDLLEQAATSRDVRAIMLTGAGSSFCPGLDADELSRVTRPGESFATTPRRKITLPTFVPKPIVCAINGACAGLGLVTALMCDVRFVARPAKLTTAYARRGLPAEDAISWLLPRICGHAVALDLLLSGRVIRGDESQALGLVHHVVEPDKLLPAAHAYAADLAAHCSPAAMAAAKRQVPDDWERTFDQSLRHAKREVARLKPHPDFGEGVRSFAERRSPGFEALTQPVDPNQVGAV